MPSLTSPGGASVATKQIQGVVLAAARAHPRSNQRAIGPSEIGEECDRRLLYSALQMAPENNQQSDPWPSIVGTAVHAWLADAFRAENAHGFRWLVEVPVKLTSGIGGTADLFDLQEREVIDHKVLGVSSMKKIKSGNIPARYRVQLHLYGYGFRLAGLDVDRVTLAAYPRSGWLADLHLWTEPYDESLALAAMDRLSKLTAAAYVLRLDEPEQAGLWAMVPARPGADCTWCPFWRPGQPADAYGCPGPEVPTTASFTPPGGAR